jgi:sulfite reductase beta subunit-like hemoprotein
MAAELSTLAERFGRGELRATVRHELEIPFVSEPRLDALAGELRRLGLCSRAPSGRPNVVSCPGADQCSVAFVKTKNLCGDIEGFLNSLAGDQAFPPEFRVAISGCPNECSQARFNDIGFVGVVGAYGGRRLQGFELVAGGSARGEGRLAERIAFVSPEDVIPTLRDLIDIYRESRVKDSTFGDFFFDVGAEEFSRLLRDKLSLRMLFFQI